MSTAGSGQSATVGTAFGAVLQATVKDASNALVFGASVTFTLPASGASGTFAGGGTTATATTNASGVASSPVITADGTVGSYTATGTVPGVATPASFTLTNVSGGTPPAITSANTTTFVVGSAGSFVFAATGTPAPAIALTGTLPSGVTYNAGTKTLSGTPAAGTGGSYALTVTASNGVGSNATQVFTLVVNQAPAITGANTTTFVVGSVGSFVFAATGTPAPAIALTGTLPSGVTYNAGTKTLSGTPAAGTGGSYALTVTASNGVGSNATQAFTLVVNQAPAITSANTSTFVVGSGGSFVFAATGTPAPAIALTGTLPSGVTYNAGTKMLSGTPAAGTGGSYALTVTASNSVGSSATQAFTLVVNQAPAITSANGATFKVAVAGTTTVTRTGFPLPTLSVSGVLPAGVTFTPGTGVLAGTPATGTSGSYPLTFTASNGVGSNATQAFTLTVQPPSAASIVSTAGSGQSATVGTAFGAVLQATVKDAANGPVAGAAVTFTLPASGASGTFAGGVTTSTATTNASGAASSPVITANATVGSYTVTATVPGVATPANFSLTNVVATSAPTITSANTTTFVVGSAGSFVFAATGTPAPAIALTGTLPSGVTYNAGTKTLSGTPAAGTGGSYALTVTASNGVGSNATQVFTLVVNQAPAITGANTTTFVVGSVGSFVFAATGTPAPAIALTGTLPSGVTYNAGTKTLSGTPAAGTGGSYALTVTASNGVGSNATQAFTLVVNQAPAITSANTSTFVVGSGGSFVFAATGTPAPAIALTGTLPSGVTYNAGTKMLSGTPAAGTGGSYALTVTASNSVGSSATQAFTLVVNQAPAITSANGATFKVAVAGTTTVTRTGFPLPTLSVSGVLPAGVTFTPGTGVLAGTPATGTSGSYPLTFTASNGVGSNATQAFTLTVQPPSAASIVSTAGSGQSATVNTAFATVLQATVKDAANGACQAPA